jgi:hypothetical protein
MSEAINYEWESAAVVGLILGRHYTVEAQYVEGAVILIATKPGERHEARAADDAPASRYAMARTLARSIGIQF